MRDIQSPEIRKIRKFVLIKGNMVQAILAANSRGIILQEPHVNSGWMGRQEVSAHCTVAEQSTTLTEWFCESGSAPFSGGTLLFYCDAQGSQ